MQMYDFTGFHWVNFFLLVAFSPVTALVCYRVLTPKYAFGKTLLISVPVISVISAFSIAAAHVNSSGVSISGIIEALLEFVAYGILWRCLTKDKLAKILLFYIGWIVVMGVGFSAGSLVYDLYVRVTGTDNLLDAALRGVARELFAEVFQAIFSIVISGELAKRMRKVAVDVRWSMFSLMLLTQALAMLMMVGFLTWRKYSTVNVLLLAIFTLLCILVDIYVLRMLRTMVRNAELEQHIALLNQQQALQQERYAAASEQMQNMCRLRHDYINTLTTIDTLLAMGETEKLQEILDGTSRQLDKARLVCTGNQIVDAVLYSKQLSAKQKGMTLSVQLLWPETLQISDTDLMRIFANLLDNAIHYCETLPDDVDRRIEVTSILRGRILVLCFSNPYLGEKPPEIPESGHIDPAGIHGNGLAIVRDIAENSGGTLAVSCSDGVLTFRVLLSCPETQQIQNA